MRTTYRCEEINTHGGYGIKVITEVCGTFNSGSIPGSRPNEPTLFWGLFFWVTTGRNFR
jgi:hypothetical protein